MKVSFFILISILPFISKGQTNLIEKAVYSGKYKAKDGDGVYGGKFFRDSKKGGLTLNFTENTYFMNNDDLKQYGSYSISNNDINFKLDSVYIQRGYFIEHVAINQYSAISKEDIDYDFNRDRSNDQAYFLYDLDTDKWDVRNQWYSLSGVFNINVSGNKLIITRNNEIGKWSMKLNKE